MHRRAEQEAESFSEIRSVTISWSRAMWFGFWFAWGIAMAWIVPAVVVTLLILAAVATD